MIALIQRVSEARVEVDGAVVGAIDAGLLALVAVQPGDGEAQVQRLLERLLGYRVFADAEGRMASFSSRGPVSGVTRIRPDASAPGVNTRSATNASTTSYGTKSGTSMAGQVAQRLREQRHHAEAHPAVVGGVALHARRHDEDEAGDGFRRARRCSG